MTLNITLTSLVRLVSSIFKSTCRLTRILDSFSASIEICELTGSHKPYFDDLMCSYLRIIHTIRMVFSSRSRTLHTSRVVYFQNPTIYLFYHHGNRFAFHVMWDSYGFSRLFVDLTFYHKNENTLPLRHFNLKYGLTNTVISLVGFSCDLDQLNETDQRKLNGRRHKH